MRKKHSGSLRILKLTIVKGQFLENRKNDDIKKLQNLIQKYKTKIQNLEKSNHGHIIVLNYKVSKLNK